MLRLSSNILRLFFVLTFFLSEAFAVSFSGTVALDITKRSVALGERPSGSAALNKLRSYLETELKKTGGQVEVDSFQGRTPTGPVPMANLIVRFAGTSGKAIVMTGHYDTKRIPMMAFLGANDGGSSTGLLLELARVLATAKHADDLYVVFFDGEEAVGEWSESDSKYGSRHLADKWLTEGKLSTIKALINVDMIGDKSLDLYNDANSSESLRQQLSTVAAQQGASRYLSAERSGGIDDDHMPFVNAGVNAIDLIDFDYGPHNSYWHQAADTTDKLSAQSLQVVGNLVLGLIDKLDPAEASKARGIK